MPVLETLEGKVVDVDPPDPAAINARFQQTMSSDGSPDPATPPKRSARGAAADTARPRAGKAPRAEKSRTTATAVTLTRAQRVDGLQGWGQVGATLFAAAGKAKKSDALLADAVVIADNTGDAADAVADMCDTDPRFAVVIDKICAAGPWSALIAVGFKVGTQLARNHRPALNLPGTVHPDKLLAAEAPAAEAPAAA